MSTSNENNTGLTIALVGGGAFLAWLLWRGRGKGKGKGKDADGDHSSAREPVTVWIRSGDRVELDGVSSDLATIVARARAAGAARVFATGDARQGWFTAVMDALKAASVEVYEASWPPTAPRIGSPSDTLVPRNARTSHLPGGSVPVKAHMRRWPRHGA